MVYLQICARGMLLLISLYGYIQYLTKKMRMEFAIGFLFATIGSIMFIAGMTINILQEATFFIFTIGCYLTYLSIKRKERPKNLLCSGTVFFLIVSALFLPIIYGAQITGQDDMCHWGAVANILFDYNRFPTAANINILHQTYPLGSASFIYYITKVIGISSEWLQLYTQTILMLGMLISLFAFCHSIVDVFITGCVCVMLLIANTSILDLQVDTLLPVICIAGTAYTLFYRNTISDKIYYIVPYTVFLISIKNSGIIFAVFIYILILLTMSKEREVKKKYLNSILCLIAVIFLWKKHTNLVFENAAMARHSLSISYFMYMFENKTTMDILDITKLLCDKVFTLSNAALPILLVAVLALIIRCIRMEKKHDFTIKIMLYAIGTYLLYLLGMYAMYIFNMENDESLVSYERYHKTMVIYLTGVVYLGMMLWKTKISPIHNNRLGVTVLLFLTLLCSFMSLSPNINYLKRQDLTGTHRQKFNELIAENYIGPKERYIVLLTDEQYDNVFERVYITYHMQYLLEPYKLEVCTVDTINNVDKKEYDYIIAYAQTYDVRNYFDKELHEETKWVVYCPGGFK